MGRRRDTRARGAHAAAAHAQGRPAARRGWTAVFVIALIVLVAALAFLAALGISYYQGRSAYSGVVERAQVDTDRIDSWGSDPQKADAASAAVDWDALRAENPDTVGWIYIPGTNVNYPIVQRDNTYYLTHDFQGSTGLLAHAGAVFLDQDNAADFSDAGVFVYGHHMNDGSMFAAIDSLSDQEKFNEHRTVYLLTPNKSFRLDTLAVVHCAADDALVRSTFSGADDVRGYLGDKVERAVAKSPDASQRVDASRFFAFVTCDNAFTEGGRYVLYCTVDAETDAPEGTLAEAGAVFTGEDAQAVDGAAADTVG